jgi:hypothetical protein
VAIECRESKECAPAKHHYEECVERVTGAVDSTEKKHPNEDCVEECKCYTIPILGECCLGIHEYIGPTSIVTLSGIEG